MVEIVDKKGIKKRISVWFPPENYITKRKCDVCCYVGIKSLHDVKNQHIKFFSLLTDLTLELEDIWAGFSKVNKYDIRRADKDGISIKKISSQELCENERWYEKYEKVYEGMYEKRGCQSRRRLSR